MATDPRDKKIADLEQQVKLLLAKTSEINRQIDLLVRENNRRKSEITQLSATIKRE